MFARLLPAVALAALGRIAACGAPAATSPFSGQLAVRDVVGEWTIAFRQASNATPEVLGRLVISDRYDPLHPGFLRAEFSADFRPMLGRQVSCLQTPQSALVQPRDSVSILLWLTPEVADCGLDAIGKLEGTVFAGEWIEPSITSQPQSNGTFRMWRNT